MLAVMADRDTGQKSNDARPSAPTRVSSRIGIGRGGRNASLLAVALQHPAACDGQPRPIALQTSQDHEFILVRYGTAVPDDVVAAGDLFLRRARIGECRGGNDRKSEGQGEGSNHGFPPPANMSPRRASPGGKPFRFRAFRCGLSAVCVAAATAAESKSGSLSVRMAPGSRSPPPAFGAEISPPIARRYAEFRRTQESRLVHPERTPCTAC